jgi:hypothetical protein
MDIEGAKPADFLIEQPIKFKLNNLGTAKKLGLTITRSLLARIDQVIEEWIAAVRGIAVRRPIGPQHQVTHA